MDGKKYDSEKPRFSLVNPFWLEDVVKVLTFGAKKYGDDNWMFVKPLRERYLSAMYRHINAYHKGEVIDPESKLPHTAHISCCSMFLHWNDAQELLIKEAMKIESENH